MAHNTRTYFVENVIPSYDSFIDYYKTLEFGKHITTFKAGEIAECLLNIPEYIFYEIGDRTGYQKAKAYRDSVRTSDKGYEIVCDLANVVKHNKISRDGKSFSDINVIRESIAIVKYEDILGRYYMTRKIVEIKLLDGMTIEVGDLLLNSMLLWSEKAKNLNLIPEVPKLKELLPNFVRRKDAKSFNEVTILGIIGEYLEEQFRKMVYRRRLDKITDIRPDEKFGNFKIPCIAKIEESPFENKDE